MRLILLLLAALGLLGGCERPEPAPEPEVEATPAFWRIERNGATAGWLLGTVHALPPGIDWRGAQITTAIAQADMLVAEVADLDQAAIARHYARIARTRGLAPVADRLDASDRQRFTRLINELGLDRAQFQDVETWAAALMLSQAMAERGGLDSGAGVDRALLRDFAGRQITGLETAEGQLALFDGMAEADQRALLASTVRDANSGDGRAMAAAWTAGDLTTLSAFADAALTGTPALRERLVSARNRRWAERIDGLLAGGARPFIAVGAGHVIGEDGLPALLETAGWRVARVQ